MSKAYFRFYEELNDYLPEKQHKVWFDYDFKKKVTIYTAIQSMGVPLESIDLILVNQKSQDLGYKLQNGDRVSVYPVFELLDISGISKIRDEPLRDIKFICDSHLGKLCKYLRMLGFDTLYSYHYTQNQLIDIALSEKRIILSKDIKLKEHKDVTHFYWIRSSEPGEQMRDVIQKLDLSNHLHPLSLCLECNNKLIQID